MYLLTTCASCAAPLDSKGAKQCSRCKTRYCSAICQREHWARGGHDSLCKKIKKGGGAEEYHADTIYARARAAAVKACTVKATATIFERWCTTCWVYGI